MSHHYSNLHLRNALGHDELRLGCRDHIVRCDTWSRLQQGRATAGESSVSILRDSLRQPSDAAAATK
jgi:hypothetical protein